MREELKRALLVIEKECEGHPDCEGCQLYDYAQEQCVFNYEMPLRFAKAFEG